MCYRGPDSVFGYLPWRKRKTRTKIPPSRRALLDPQDYRLRWSQQRYSFISSNGRSEEPPALASEATYNLERLELSEGSLT